MNTEKKAKSIVFISFVTIVLIGCLFGVFYSIQEAKANEAAEAGTQAWNFTLDYEFPTPPWKEAGYSDVETYWADLTSKRESFVGISAQVQEEFAGYLSDVDITKLDELELRLTHTSSLQKLNEYEAQLNEIINTAKEARDADIAAQQITYSSSGSDGGVYYSNGSGLTASKGVNWYNGRKETYYNLDMSGVVSNAQAMGINGNYWVRDDGVKMYGDYVIVASQDSKGTLIDTSVGQGIVLDYCPAGTVDIATTW